MEDDEREYPYRRKRRGCLPMFGRIVALACLIFVLGAFLRFAGNPLEKIFSAGESSSADAADDPGGAEASEETIQALKTMEQKYPQMEPILQNSHRYPARLLDSLSRNPELLTFTLDYPEKKGSSSGNIDLSSRYQKGEVPLLMQWDEDWGYAPYGNGIIALDGCGPTCLSMVAVGLTGDTSLNPKVIADFSVKNNYLDAKTNSTLWTLMSEGAKKLGLYSHELPLNQSRMSREISQGHPIICSLRPGDFTQVGHFIVITGYKNGSFSVKDPNSKTRSEETWSYEGLKPQIRNLWAFSAER